MSTSIYVGDCVEVLGTLPAESVHCVVTSPPYWGLRNYQVDRQMGAEPTPQEYIQNLVNVFAEVHRVLRSDGTVWLNLGDSYVGTGNKGDYRDPKYKDGRNGQAVSLNRKVDGLKSKDLMMMPHRVAIALQEWGWWVRQTIIWEKPNAMPSSVKDRPSTSHEYIFLLTKSKKYFYDAAAVAEPAKRVGDVQIFGGQKALNNPIAADDPRSRKGHEQWGRTHEQGATRNRRTVWTIATSSFKGAHFATMPTQLPELCIKAGCPKDGTVLDPFGGAGTVGLVAERLERNAILIELNPDYAELARRRIYEDSPMFNKVSVHQCED